MNHTYGIKRNQKNTIITVEKGIANAEIEHIGSDSYLETISVDLAYRGKGLGRELFSIVTAEAILRGSESLSAVIANEKVAYMFAKLPFDITVSRTITTPEDYPDCLLTINAITAYLDSLRASSSDDSGMLGVMFYVSAEL